MSLRREQVIEIMKQVQLAPSAHNSQPAKWLYKEGIFTLTVDPERKLPVADLTEHDLELSLGAQIEGLSIALSNLLYEIDNIRKESKEKYLIKIKSSSSMQVDPLSERVKIRRTYRGSYSKACPESLKELKAAYEGRKDIQLIFDKKKIKKIASIYDATTKLFFDDSSYRKELYQWLRFSKKQEKWSEDGLNTESMALKPYEAFFARYILKPDVYSVLNKIKIAPFLISEASTIVSSSFIFCILKSKKSTDNISLGRQFYRQWLEIDQKGFNICPLSNAIDHPLGKEQLQEIIPTEEGQEVFKVFRAGPHPDEKLKPRSCRLNFHNYFEYKDSKND